MFDFFRDLISDLRHWNRMRKLKRLARRFAYETYQPLDDRALVEAGATLDQSRRGAYPLATGTVEDWADAGIVPIPSEFMQEDRRRLLAAVRGEPMLLTEYETRYGTSADTPTGPAPKLDPVYLTTVQVLDEFRHLPADEIQLRHLCPASRLGAEARGFVLDHNGARAERNPPVDYNPLVGEVADELTLGAKTVYVTPHPHIDGLSGRIRP